MHVHRFLMLVGGAFLQGEPIQGAPEYSMRANAVGCLNVRPTPADTGKPIACLDLGTQLLARETTGTWRRVQLNDGREGWAAKAYLEITPIPVVRTSSKEAVAEPRGPSDTGTVGWALLGLIALVLAYVGGRFTAPQRPAPGLPGQGDVTGRIDAVLKSMDAVLASREAVSSSGGRTSPDNGAKEIVSALQRALDERDQELKRHKRGYDAAVFRRFLHRFIRVAQTLDEQQATPVNAQGDLQMIRRLMDDALDECGVERFVPNVGDDYRKIPGIGDGPKTLPARSPQDQFRIAEVVEAGYRLRGAENPEVLVPARVRIYL